MSMKQTLRSLDVCKKCEKFLTTGKRSFACGLLYPDEGGVTWYVEKEAFEEESVPEECVYNLEHLVLHDRRRGIWERFIQRFMKKG